MRLMWRVIAVILLALAGYGLLAQVALSAFPWSLLPIGVLAIAVWITLSAERVRVAQLILWALLLAAVAGVAVAGNLWNASRLAEPMRIVVPVVTVCVPIFLLLAGAFSLWRLGAGSESARAA